MRCFRLINSGLSEGKKQRARTLANMINTCPQKGSMYVVWPTSHFYKSLLITEFDRNALAVKLISTKPITSSNLDAAGLHTLTQFQAL